MPSVSRSDFNRLLSLKAIDPNGAVRFEIRHDNVSYFPGGEAFVVAGETTAQATLKLETPAVTPKPLPVPDPAPAPKVEPVEDKPAPKAEEKPEPKAEHKPARHPRKEVNRGDS